MSLAEQVEQMNAEKNRLYQETLRQVLAAHLALLSQLNVEEARYAGLIPSPSVLEAIQMLHRHKERVLDGVECVQEGLARLLQLSEKGK